MLKCYTVHKNSCRNCSSEMLLTHFNLRFHPARIRKVNSHLCRWCPYCGDQQGRGLGSAGGLGGGSKVHRSWIGPRSRWQQCVYTHKEASTMALDRIDTIRESVWSITPAVLLLLFFLLVLSGNNIFNFHFLFLASALICFSVGSFNRQSPRFPRSCRHLRRNRSHLDTDPPPPTPSAEQNPFDSCGPGWKTNRR